MSLCEIARIRSGDRNRSNGQRGRPQIRERDYLCSAGHADGNRAEAQTGWRKFRGSPDSAERYLLRAARGVVGDAQGCIAPVTTIPG